MGTIRLFDYFLFTLGLATYWVDEGVQLKQSMEMVQDCHLNNKKMGYTAFSSIWFLFHGPFASADTRKK